MSSMQIRGYLVPTTSAFIRDKVGDGEWQKILVGLTPQTQDLIKNAKPAAWVPVAALNELTHVIVTDVARKDPEQARDALYNCAKYAAREATNSFLKMLMKLLTPGMFAKKLPDIFRRDFDSGRLVVEVADRTLTCRMYELKNFEHGGVLCPGFASFALESMGKTIEKYTISDWSPDAPNIDGTGFALTWSE